MDIKCRACREPWDLYGLVHDERILNVPAAAETAGVDAFRAESPDGGAFVFLAPAGLDEAAEGALALLSCPACEESADVGARGLLRDAAERRRKGEGAR